MIWSQWAAAFAPWGRNCMIVWCPPVSTAGSRVSTIKDLLTWLGAPGSWEHLIRQSGMFGFLGLPPSVVQRLRGSFCRWNCHFSEMLTRGDLRAISHLHGRQLSHINCWSQQTKRGLRGKVNHWVFEARMLVETPIENWRDSEVVRFWCWVNCPEGLLQ